MPKIKPRKSNTLPRSKPYHTPSKPTAFRPRQDSGGQKIQPYFRFLDLPAELQLEIYGYFSHASPSTFTIDVKNAISKTRRSLLLTSREVNEAFCPMFYRSATIAIRNRPESAIPEAKSRSLQDFTYVFLKSDSIGLRARYLHRLELDATLCLVLTPRHGRSGYQFVDSECLTWFTVFLQHHIHALPSLREIKVFASQGYWEGFRYNYLASPLKRYQKVNMDHIVSLEQKLLGRGRGAVLQGWKAETMFDFTIYNSSHSWAILRDSSISITLRREI